MSQYSIQVTFSQSLGASFNDNNGNPYTNVSGNIYLSQGNLSSIGNNAFDASMNANFKFLTFGQPEVLAFIIPVFVQRIQL